MKVLQVSPSLNRIYGGPVYSLVAFARAAQLSGVEATVAGPRAPDNELAWMSGELPQATIHGFDTVGSDAFIFSAPLLRWLKRNAKQFDVIHIHGLLNPVSSLAGRIARHEGVPYVVHPFGTLSRYTFTHRRRLLKMAYFRGVDAPNIRSAGAIHFTTETERDEAAWHNLNLAPRAHVVPPPWIGDFSHSPRESVKSSSRVLIMARLHPVKDVELLISAWPTVLAAIPGATLTIAGDGKPDYVKSLKKAADSLGPDAHIDFTGFVRAGRKAELLASADVFVLPSYHENFGVVVLEALAARVPVVITREVQLCSFVEANALGRVVRRDATELGRAIVETLHDAELKARCSLVAPHLVEENFSPATLQGRLLRMYNSAIDTTRARS